MGYDANRYKTQNLIIRVESGKLILPQDVGATLLNMTSTGEGTLLSVNGPAPYLPNYGDGYFDYGNPHGIFHAVLNGSTHIKDVLLCHTGNAVRVFEGFNRSWRTLIGTGITQVYAELPDDTSPRYPTQFEATPTGIVIVPQGHDRAYFYDGETCLPLGYSMAPPAPNGTGPEDSVDNTKTPLEVLPNSVGYYGGTQIIGDKADLGHGRIGTVESDVTSVSTGTVLPGAYQASYQWIDQFGNLSPNSGRSNSVTISRETVEKGEQLDWYLKMILWTGIQPGPDGTIGRIISRTKDTHNTGTADLFEVSGNSTYGTSGSFATIPDNVSEKWPDNVPDSWLFTRPPEIMAVPPFKLCRLALGRLWIAGIKGNPSAIIPSLPGRWGTFAVDTEEYPDPAGGEITGMWSVMGGLIVTTFTSTFLITPGIDGTWIKQTIHPSIGCVAPDSMKNTPSGYTLWLAREGFVKYTPASGPNGMSIEVISDGNTGIRPLTDRINPGRALQATAVVDLPSNEYRCWVAIDGGTENTFCFCYDTDNNGWRRRTGESPRAVCLTKDHRAYILMAGYAYKDIRSPITAPTMVFPSPIPSKYEPYDMTYPSEYGGRFPIIPPLLGVPSPSPEDADGDLIDYNRGVWLLDHEVESFWPEPREHRIETSWIEGARSKEGKSAKLVYVWLRETVKGAAKIQIHRDWRIRSSAAYEADNAVLLYDENDVPTLWGVARWGQKGAEWCTRRPFWRKVSVYVPDCEVYKIVITSTSKMEFLGISMDELPQPGSGRVGGR